MQLSALLVVLPGGQAIFSVATNKLASVVGTASAAVTFARRVPLDRRHVLPMAAAAFAGAVGGALLAALLPSRVLTVVVLVALVAVGLYTRRRPQLGAVHAPRFARRTQGAVMAAAAPRSASTTASPARAPGRSWCSCWWAGRVRVPGGVGDGQGGQHRDQLRCARVLLLPAGVVLLGLGAVLAVANLAGAVLGARVAVRRGSGFVRRVFLRRRGRPCGHAAVRLVARYFLL